MPEVVNKMRKNIAVVGYEALWNVFSFAPNLYVALEKTYRQENIGCKLLSIAERQKLC